MAGIPPLAGFIGKWFVFASAASVGDYALVAFAAINSVIALYYYLQIVRAAWVNESTEVLSPISISISQRIMLVFLALGVLFSGIVPLIHTYIYTVIVWNS